MLFLFYANTLPDMKSSRVATFADDTKILNHRYSRGISLLLLQADWRNLTCWSSSVGPAFNESKCKMQQITRKLNPLIATYELKKHALGISTTEKDQGVVISDNLLWDNQVCAVCSKSNRMLGFVQHNTWCIKNVSNNPSF